VAASQGLDAPAYRAAAAARRLEHSWIGPEHVLLALSDEPSAATEAVEELGVTRERVEQDARALGHSDPPGRPMRPG
jgi:ATP-dependent Clp protease ATP-binding subunit ClpA